MAKPASTRCAWRNASIASSYSKLWSRSRPRMKGACAAAAPDVGKETRPSDGDTDGVGVGLGLGVGWAARDATTATTVSEQPRTGSSRTEPDTPKILLRVR